METQSKKLDRWLRKQAFGDYDDALSRLVIKHSPQGAKGSVVGQKDVEQVSTEDLQELTAEILQMIGDDASGMGGVQRYIVESYHGERESPSARFSMRLEGIDESIDDGNDAEPPTKGGLVTQQMRHNEVLMKTFANTVGSAVQTLQRTITRQAEHIEVLLDQRFKSIEIVEEAMSRKHERDIEFIREGASQERKDKLVDKGAMLIPVIANKLAGYKLLPGGESPRDSMLREFVNSLNPEQFQSIQQSLAPEQLIVLVNLLQSYKAEEEAKKTKESKDEHAKNGS